MPKSTSLALNDNLVDHLASTGFLGTYVKYASDLTDSPKIFHLGIGLAIIAAALGNRVYGNLWGRNVYPNLWICLLSPSGFYRKTTAINLGIEPLRKAQPDAVLAGDFTREALVDTLSKQPAGIIPIYELGSLLGQMQKDYMRGTMEMLTDLWDSPSEYRRSLRREGETVIYDPALSLLAASTLDWLQDRISKKDLRAGFYNRFLFLPAKSKNGWKGLVPLSDINRTIKNNIETWLGDIRNRKGAVDVSEINTPLDAWAKSQEKEITDNHVEPELTGFFARATSYAFKLAILFHVSRPGDNLRINQDALADATLLLEAIRDSTLTLIREDFTFSRTDMELRRLMEIITQADGRIEQGEWLKRSKLLSRQFHEQVQTLIQSGQVSPPVKEPTATKPKLIYTLK